MEEEFIIPTFSEPVIVQEEPVIVQEEPVIEPLEILPKVPVLGTYGLVGNFLIKY